MSFDLIMSFRYDFLTSFVSQQFKSNKSAAQNVKPSIGSKLHIITPNRSSVPNSNFLGLPDWCPCCIEKSMMESRCSKSLKLKSDKLTKTSPQRKG